MEVAEIKDWFDFQTWLENYWAENPDDADSIWELVLVSPPPEVQAAIEQVLSVENVCLAKSIWGGKHDKHVGRTRNFSCRLSCEKS